mmetsp:Transcript_2048/g.3621  ORF Transcript_2048/g.3621 Transcript_2048/m.3621 type:complete len:154 (+) Transcript_2048:771-1232(+)
MHDSVGINVKRHFDLRGSSWSRWNSHQVKLTQRLVVNCHFAFSLQHLDSDLRLIVGSGRECLALLGGNRCVAVDQTRKHSSQSLNSQREWSYIQQQNVFHVSAKHSSLNRCTKRHNFVGIHSTARILLEKVLDNFLYRRHSRHSSDEKHFVDI